MSPGCESEEGKDGKDSLHPTPTRAKPKRYNPCRHPNVHKSNERYNLEDVKLSEREEEERTEERGRTRYAEPTILPLRLSSKRESAEEEKRSGDAYSNG